MGSGNWFQEVIGQYSETYIQTLYDLLRSLNDLGTNVSDLLKNVLTNPQLTKEDIEEMIHKIDALSSSGVQAAAEDSSEKVLNLNHTIDEFSTADSQLEILNFLIEKASKYVKRVALFIISGERTIGWLAWGFVQETPNEISRKKLEIAYASGTLIYDIQQSGQIFKGQIPGSQDNSRLLQDLGGILPPEIACIPLITKNRVSAILYLDQGDTQQPIGDLSLLEVEVKIAGMMIDLIPLRKSLARKEESAPAPQMSQSPTPSQPATGGLPFQQAPAAQPPTGGLPFQQPQEQAPPSQPALPFIQPGGGTADAGPMSTQPPAEMPPPQEAQPDPILDLPPIPGAPEPAPQAPAQQSDGGLPPFQIQQQSIPEPPPAEEPRTGTFGLNEQAQQAPPEKPPMGFQIGAQGINPPASPGGNVAPFPPSGAEQATDNKELRQAQDEAKRFARLLILEIKLYNEDKVMEGRKNKNLYSLLKEEIDRSKEVFAERITGDLADSESYFKDELINILAGGDASALGM